MVSLMRMRIRCNFEDFMGINDTPTFTLVKHQQPRLSFVLTEFSPSMMHNFDFSHCTEIGYTRSATNTLVGN